MDNDTIFHICCGNFNIEEAPSIPFEDEGVVRTVAAAPQEPELKQTTALRELVADVALNVNKELSQEISELRHQGTDVDNNNDPAHENAQPSAPSTQTIWQWVTPTFFLRRADVNYLNTKCVWRLHSWPKISEMTEISLFRMALTEQCVRDVLISATKKKIAGDNIILQEFYVYLGCQFFMEFFEGIYDQRLWWSLEPVSIREGAPFYLQKYMALRRFISITSAMRFTNKTSPSFFDRFHDVRQMINNFNETIWRTALPPVSAVSMI